MIMAVYQGLDWFSRQYQKVLRPFIVLLYIVLTLVVLYAVYMRYVINDSPRWTEEMARYLMVWASLLAMSIGMREHRHIGLTTLVKRLWGKYTKRVFLVADIAMLIFFAVVFVTGIMMTSFVTKQHSPSMNLPMWVPYLSIPVGAFFLTVETLILLLRKVVRLEEDEDESEQVDTQPLAT